MKRESQSTMCDEFAEAHPNDWRYCDSWGYWLGWNGHWWGRDEVRAVREAVRAQYAGDAFEVNSVVTLLMAHPLYATYPGQWDQHPQLLACPNGTVDLRTGNLMAADAGLLISKGSPQEYDPLAAHPMWDDFLATVQPNGEIQQFLKRAVGYTLTGETAAEALFFLYGPRAANGKTTLTHVITGLLGPYARPLDLSWLIKGAEEHQIAELFGTRFVHANEVGKASKFNEQTLKRLVSTDPLSGRFKYGRSTFHFQPTHKLWIRGNNQPQVDSEDEGLWRRLIQVPFDRQVPEDKRIADYHRVLLDSEALGILAWAVEGAVEYYAHGLQVPQVIRTSTRSYRSSQDVVSLWRDQNCVDVAHCVTPTQVLLRDFEAWCREEGYPAPSPQLLGRRLARLGYEQERTSSAKGWKGIALAAGRSADDDPSLDAYNGPEDGEDAVARVLYAFPGAAVN